MNIGRHRFVSFLVITSFFVAQPGFSQEQEASVDLIGDFEYIRPDLSTVPPVELDIWQQDGPLGVSFVKPDPNGIEIQMADGQGSVVVFWEFMDQFQISMPQSKEVADAFRISDPEIRAERVAPIVEPLFPLASIPPDSTNIHRLIDQYLETLVQAKDWEKLYELSNKVFLDKCPKSSIDYFFAAAKNLFLSGDEERAMALLNQLVAARPIKESKKDTLEIAAQFMEEHLFVPALRLYQTFAPHTQGSEGKRIRLICAYLNLELGNEERSQSFIDEADKMKANDLQSQATRRLIGGVQAQKKNEADSALDQLGFALSVLEPSDSLRVIALYYNFRTYQALDKPVIADSIFKEMQLLFGQSKYTSEISEEQPEAPKETES